MPRKKGGSNLTADQHSTDIKPSSETKNEKNEIDSVSTNDNPPVMKKRGRRPKGGKIITTDKQLNTQVITLQENIILHLRCSLEDLNVSGSISESMTKLQYNPDVENVKAYSSPALFGNLSQSSSLNYHEIDEPSSKIKMDDMIVSGADMQPEMKDMFEIENMNNMNKNILDNECSTNSEPDSSDTIAQEKNMTIINTKLHHLSKEMHT